VVPVSALTALEGLTVGRVEPVQHVLVIGASDGVGSYAVQLAKAFGAEVTGVASTPKLDLVRSLGADHVIGYTRDDFADGARRYDLILDNVGNPSLTRLRRARTTTGTAVITGGEDGGSLTGGLDRQLRGRVLSLFVRQRLTNFVNKEHGSDLGRLTNLIEAGKVTPSIDRTWSLDKAPEAMRHLEAGKARGNHHGQRSCALVRPRGCSPRLPGPCSRGDDRDQQRLNGLVRHRVEQRGVHDKAY